MTTHPFLLVINASKIINKIRVKDKDIIESPNGRKNGTTHVRYRDPIEVHIK